MDSPYSTPVKNEVARKLSLASNNQSDVGEDSELLHEIENKSTAAGPNTSSSTKKKIKKQVIKYIDVTEEMKISFNRRRLYAIEKINEINNISVGNPTGAFYLFVDVSQYCNGNYEGINSSIDFCNWLLDKYFIAFVPGEVFGAPGYMRLSYALSDDELSEGLERLNKAVEELNG